MTITVKYVGNVERWPELDATGNQSVWFPGQIEERSDAEAALLIAAGDFVRLDAPLQLPTYTVAMLPAAASATGQRAFVSDADTPVVGDPVTGDGADMAPVWSNGTDWVVG